MTSEEKVGRVFIGDHEGASAGVMDDFRGGDQHVKRIVWHGR